MKCIICMLFYIAVIIQGEESQVDREKRRFITIYEFRCRHAKLEFNIEFFLGTQMCLHWSNVRLIFLKAKSSCEAMGARLGVFNTHEKWNILLRHYKLTGHDFWIGYDDLKSEGKWVWHDGSVLDPKDHGKFWRAGEPNNYNRNEDCAYMTPEMLLNDGFCNSRALYVCEALV